MSSVYYLTYASKITLKSLFNSHILCEITEEAHRFNLPQAITGFLCYGRRHFFQYIEGEQEVIEALYRKLVKDRRHQRMTVITTGSHVRRFPTWSMYVVTLEQLVNQTSKAYEFMPFSPMRWDEHTAMRFVRLFDDCYTFPKPMLTNTSTSAGIQYTKDRLYHNLAVSC